jgi:PEP-CTERM motif
MRKLLGLMLAAACIVSQPALADTLTVDFSTIPGADGKLGTADDLPMPAHAWPGWIREELAPAGIHFTVGSMAQGPHFDGNPANVYLTSTSPEAYFDMPVYGISIDSYSMWNATLTAYDIGGNVIATDRILNESQEFAYDTLKVTSATPIYRFSVLADREGPILNLDNLVLTVSPVPEPSQFALFGTGLAALGIAARRRNKKAA